MSFATGYAIGLASSHHGHGNITPEQALALYIVLTFITLPGVITGVVKWIKNKDFEEGFLDSFFTFVSGAFFVSIQVLFFIMVMVEWLSRCL